MTVHEAYGFTRFTTGANDIALVRLRSPAVTIMEDVKSVVLPICLDFKNNFDNMENYVAGWGKTDNKAITENKDFTELGVSSRTLQRLRLPAMSFAKCKAIFPFVTPQQFCFGGLSLLQVLFVHLLQHVFAGITLAIQACLLRRCML